MGDRELMEWSVKAERAQSRIIDAKEELETALDWYDRNPSPDWLSRCRENYSRLVRNINLAQQLELNPPRRSEEKGISPAVDHMMTALDDAKEPAFDVLDRAEEYEEIGDHDYDFS